MKILITQTLVARLQVLKDLRVATFFVGVMNSRAFQVTPPPFFPGVALENVSAEASGIRVVQLFQTFHRLIISGATSNFIHFSLKSSSICSSLETSLKRNLICSLAESRVRGLFMKL